MERAGRRRLLLTGFISIAACNLLMTIVDSVLVKTSFHSGSEEIPGMSNF